MRFYSKQDFYDAIMLYLKKTKEGNKTPTFSGLAVALKTPKRELLDILNNEQHKLNEILKSAVGVIEGALEAALISGEQRNMVGIIFALKQAPFNWADKRQIEVSERRLKEVVDSLTREQKIKYITKGKLPKFVSKGTNLN